MIGPGGYINGQRQAERLFERLLARFRFVAVFLFGTFAPFLRASFKPIATACFLLVTFLPLPDFSVPRLRLCIAPPTDSDAFLLDLRPLEALRPLFFVAMREIAGKTRANSHMQTHSPKSLPSGRHVFVPCPPPAQLQNTSSSGMHTVSTCLAPHVP